MEDIKKIQEFFSKPVKENSRRSPDFILIDPAEIKYTESFGSGIKAPGVLHHANEGVFLGAEGAYIIVLPGGTFYVDEDKEEAIPIYPIKDQSREFQLALDYTPFSPKYETWKSWVKRPETLGETDVNEELSLEQKKVERFLKAIAKEFDYSIQDAANFVKSTISQMGLKESVNEDEATTKKIIIKKSELGKYDGTRDMLNRAWQEFVLRYAKQNNIKFKNLSDAEYIVKKTFKIPSPDNRYNEDSARYLMNNGTLVLKESVNEQADHVSPMVAKAYREYLQAKKDGDGEKAYRYYSKKLNNTYSTRADRDAIEAILKKKYGSAMMDEATKDEETEFHKKLDTLVHDTFGKRKGEMEEYQTGIYYKGEETQDKTKEASKSALEKVKDMIQKVLKEEEGYSQFLKTDDNPEGKTKGLDTKTMNKILMNVIKDLDELKQLGEGVIEEELCPKGKAYIKKRQAAGEKSSAYLSGRAVKVCKGQMKG